MGRGFKYFEELFKSPVGQTNKIGWEINRKKYKMYHSIMRALKKNEYVHVILK
jgi:hypothetical protein